MIAGLVYAIMGLVAGIIGLRFVLRLVGANPASPFVAWIYDWSTPLVTPFAGILGQEATVTGPGAVTSSVFDWTALIALVIYGIVFGLLGRVFGRR